MVLAAQIVTGLLTIVACVYWLMTVPAAFRWRARSGSQDGPQNDMHPPVTVLKPLCGADPFLADNLESFCRQDYPCYQVVLGAASPDDPALSVAREVATRFPHTDIALVSGGNLKGRNRKVCNLANLLRHAQHDLIVLADSDMRVAPDYLKQVTAPFADQAVGLVTCPYRGAEARGIASSLESLGIGCEFVPSALVAVMLQGASFAFGSTIVLRKQTLERMGGFESLADEVADDYLLGQGTVRQGLSIVMSGCVVDDVLGAEPFREMRSRRLRWARTIRVLRPTEFAGSGVTYGLAWALLFLLSVSGAPIGWWVLAAVLAVRAATALAVTRCCTHDRCLPRLLPLLPVSDLVSFALWVGGLCGRTVLWRGEQLRLGIGGRIDAGTDDPPVPGEDSHLGTGKRSTL